MTFVIARRSFSMRFALWAVIAASSAILVLPQSASAVDILSSSGLPSPDALKRVADGLGLTANQQAAIDKVMSAAREKAEPLEKAVRDQEALFGRQLRDTNVSLANAETSLTKLLEAEAAVKKIQLQTLLEVRKILTADQLAKAMTMAVPKGLGAGDVPAQVMKKMTGLKEAVEQLGVPPTKAMMARATEIESLLKQSKYDAAEAAIDKLVVDSHLKDLAAAGEVPDFTKFDAGDTDDQALKARFDAVQSKAEEVVSLLLLRDLLKAKDAFKDAKDAQDATRVGRVLTWTEQKLAIKK